MASNPNVSNAEGGYSQDGFRSGPLDGGSGAAPTRRFDDDEVDPFDTHPSQSYQQQEYSLNHRSSHDHYGEDVDPLAKGPSVGGQNETAPTSSTTPKLRTITPETAAQYYTEQGQAPEIVDTPTNENTSHSNVGGISNGVTGTGTDAPDNSYVPKQNVAAEIAGERRGVPENDGGPQDSSLAPDAAHTSGGGGNVEPHSSEAPTEKTYGGSGVVNSQPTTKPEIGSNNNATGSKQANASKEDKKTCFCF